MKPELNLFDSHLCLAHSLSEVSTLTQSKLVSDTAPYLSISEDDTRNS